MELGACKLCRERLNLQKFLVVICKIYVGGKFCKIWLFAKFDIDICGIFANLGGGRFYLQNIMG